MADGVRAIAALPDPVGEVIDGQRLRQRPRRAQGARPARRRRRRLRGAAERHHRRRRAVPEVRQRDRAARLVVGRALQRRARARSPPRPRPRPACPTGAIALVAGGGRDELAELATQEGVVDLIIPRGGEGLKAALKGVATVPVIYAASGNCHVYVDASADLDDAPADRRQRQDPAAGRLQRGRDAARARRRRAGVPAARARRAARGRASSCASTGARARWPASALAGALADATDEDWATEFLALILAVGVVDSVEEAIEHINAPRLAGTPRRSSPTTSQRRARSSAASTRPASTSTPRRASPTAASSAWAPRSATRPRSCTRAARSACASCAPTSTWSHGDGHVRRVTPRVGLRGRHPRRHVQPAAPRPPGLRAGGARPAGARPRRCFVPVACRRTRRPRRSRARTARVELCRLAVADDERFEVSALELERGGASYTVDTLRELHDRAPGARADLHRRRRHGPEPAARGASPRPCCASRGSPSPSARRCAARTSCAASRRCTAAIACVFFDMPRIDVSSSAVRERVAARAADPLPRARRGRRCDRGARAVSTRRGEAPHDPEPRAARHHDRRPRGRQEGDRHRRARPARGRRLHRLLRHLLGQHRPPGEGDPRRDPPGAQEASTACCRAASRACARRAGS